jgi:hypothetical protein
LNDDGPAIEFRDSQRVLGWKDLLHRFRDLEIARFAGNATLQRDFTDSW